MIISRTPFRVSLFGGGSDYPQWYRKRGGAVLGFAINKYCYISLRRLPPFFFHKHRIVYSKIETVNSSEEIQHPAARNVLLEMGIESGLEIHHDGDLPALSGLGSSSSFTVGLLNALHALDSRMIPKRALAQQAIHIEQNVIKENVGSQDQIWATYGGINRIDFHYDESFQVRPLIMSSERRQELLSSFLLVFTGLSRYASDVAKKKIANLEDRTAQIERMVEMVDEAESILADNKRPIEEIGALLHDSWQLKRELADGVTRPEIDAMYDAAREAGAIGGKLLGAGGGGFMLLQVPSHRLAAVKDSLAGHISLPLDIDASGSKIVVYEPDGLELR
jgi:D-glycero-alpha-D-manno-heptose-7-phosphate kinase